MSKEDAHAAIAAVLTPTTQRDGQAPAAPDPRTVALAEALLWAITKIDTLEAKVDALALMIAPWRLDE